MAKGTNADNRDTLRFHGASRAHSVSTAFTHSWEYYRGREHESNDTYSTLNNSRHALYMGFFSARRQFCKSVHDMRTLQYYFGGSVAEVQKTYKQQPPPVSGGWSLLGQWKRGPDSATISCEWATWQRMTSFRLEAIVAGSAGNEQMSSSAWRSTPMNAAAEYLRNAHQSRSLARQCGASARAGCANWFH